jgi:hypothetical protein
MNRRFTREELEQLKDAEIHFRTTINSKYKRATGSKLDTLVADLYDAATGGKIVRNFTCGICSYNMYLEIGRKYFADKEYYEKEKVETELEPKVVNDSLSEENTDVENNLATDKENKNEKKDSRRSASRKAKD